MPRKEEYRSVNVSLDDITKLDALPGNSRQAKIKQLIQQEYDRQITPEAEKIGDINNVDAVINYLITRIPQWRTDQVWKLVYSLLDWLQSTHKVH